ncbi:LysE family translocator [Aeromicrobium tamlense]|uniref:LysE family translocator n=1 Tax=Aeromicrobium tamlense TaxID=375541 RepID=A0A8I0FY30_9ACTN|nr:MULTISPECIES: LysE family translocator [Aeromicrobium]MBD1269479.1 LysE family translocator [Aeromicrobium tamlense]NYI39867.1 threonine/homoserine/homoserine lactone efflux protein [Aeromicrobium tamlense]
MPALDQLLAFALASLVLILIPGPSVLFVIGRSLAHGRRAGILSVLGNGLGGLPVVLAVSLGLGAIVAGSAVLFTIVKVLGAGYLVYLGVQAMRHASIAVTAEVDGPEESPWRALGEGFVVGATNPKTIVFFVAVLPQFVSFESGAIGSQMAVLGVLFLLIAIVCDSGWALLAGTARQWFTGSPRRLAAVRRSGGAMLVGLGGILLTTSRT